MRVGVIGLGYVGLPLATAFAEAGHNVLGVDMDQRKLEVLRAGHSYIPSVTSERWARLHDADKVMVAHDTKGLATCEAIVVCVPTPLTKQREPDLGYVMQAAKSIGQRIQPGALVVLESTSYPGTTDGPFRREIDTISRLCAGKDYSLAFSPEREDPGNKDFSVSTIPKVVGGLTPQCTEKAAALYQTICSNVIPVADCRTAEAVKLLENTFRCVNIALVNELKLVYAAMGIDIWQVIEAAKTKPFGFMPFYPGPGLGGHCIPIDPFYLTWKAREYGQSTRFIELAGEINTMMPHYVFERLVEALNTRCRSVNGSKVLLLGLAYKPNVGDDRESPAYEVAELLEEAGAQVVCHDPHVRQSEHGIKQVEFTNETLADVDAVVVITKHDAVDVSLLAGHRHLVVVDTRGVCPDSLNQHGMGRVLFRA